MLLALDARGSLFLGCTISEPVADRLRAGGALIFPAVPDVPFDPWRAQLYTPAELYDGLERRLPGHARRARSTPGRRRRHAGLDLARLLAPVAARQLDRRRARGVHAPAPDRRRDGRARAGARRSGVRRRRAARPGPRRARAHRGDRRRPRCDGGREPRRPPGRRRPGHARPACSAEIAEVPSFEPDRSPPGHSAALDAVADLADSGRSLGIPTWFYGHEPPNAFSSAIAKYFRNAIREDVLLQVCRGGIVFLPGSAGHGPGDLPGGLHELLRTGAGGGADGLRRRPTTGPGRCRPGR